MRRQRRSCRMSQLWFVDRSKSNVDRSEVLPTGASFYRQEQSWRPFQPLERLERPVWAAWGPIWAAWEPGKPVWTRLTWPQDGVLSTRAMPTGGRFCRQAHCFVDKGLRQAHWFIDRSNPGDHPGRWSGLKGLCGRLGVLSGRPGSLGNLSGPVRHGHKTVFCRQKQCRQKESFADRRIVLSTKAFLEAVPAAGAACEACLGGLGAYQGGLEAWEACLGVLLWRVWASC